MKEEVFKNQSVLEVSTFIQEYGILLRGMCQNNRRLLEVNFTNINTCEQDDEYEETTHSYFTYKDNWKGKNAKNENLFNDVMEKTEKGLIKDVIQRQMM